MPQEYSDREAEILQAGVNFFLEFAAERSVDVNMTDGTQAKIATVQSRLWGWSSTTVRTSRKITIAPCPPLSPPTLTFALAQPRKW
jgi:hypothetical protein